MENIKIENICYIHSLNEDKVISTDSNAIHNKDIPNYLYKLQDSNKEALHYWNTLDWEHIDPLDIRYYIALDSAIQERNNYSKSFMDIFSFGLGLQGLFINSQHNDVFFNIKAPKYGVHEGVENFLKIRNSNDFANVFLSNTNYDYLPSPIRELEYLSKNGVYSNYFLPYEAFWYYSDDRPQMHLYAITNILKQTYNTIKKSKHHITADTIFYFVDFFKIYHEEIKYTISYFSRCVGTELADIKLYCLDFDAYMENKYHNYKYIPWISFMKRIYPNFDINIEMFNSFYEDYYYDIWNDEGTEIVDKILINELKITSYKVKINTSAEEMFDYIADYFFSKTIKIDKTLYPQSPRGMLEYKPGEAVKTTSDFYTDNGSFSDDIKISTYSSSSFNFHFNLYCSIWFLEEEFFLAALGERNYYNSGELEGEYGIFNPEILKRIKTDAFPWLQRFFDFNTRYTFNYCNKIKLKRPLYGKLRAFGFVSTSFTKRYLELPLKVSTDGLEYEIEFNKIQEVSQYFSNDYKFKYDIPSFLKENKQIQKSPFYHENFPYNDTTWNKFERLLVSKQPLESWNISYDSPLINRIIINSGLTVDVRVEHIYVDYNDGPHPFEFV